MIKKMFTLTILTTAPALIKAETTDEIVKRLRAKASQKIAPATNNTTTTEHIVAKLQAKKASSTGIDSASSPVSLSFEPPAEPTQTTTISKPAITATSTATTKLTTAAPTNDTAVKQLQEATAYNTVLTELIKKVAAAGSTYGQWLQRLLTEDVQLTRLFNNLTSEQKAAMQKMIQTK